ncbi:MAG: hypothetical protein ACREOB_05005, partial [Thermodesulfobacteriota bacterium]
YQSPADLADATGKGAIIPQALFSGCWTELQEVSTDWGNFYVCIRHCIISYKVSPFRYISHHLVGLC